MQLSSAFQGVFLDVDALNRCESNALLNYLLRRARCTKNLGFSIKKI